MDLCFMPAYTNFTRILKNSQNPLGTSVLLILSWIALSDGNLDDSELAQLQEIASASSSGSDINKLLEIIESRDVEAIRLASEVVKAHFTGTKARLFLEMAIQMSIADNYLLPSENHILRYISDLLNISKPLLNSIFTEFTGKAIPEPSDPSYASYWSSQSRPNNSEDNLSRLDKAYVTLGIEKGATLQEIKKAYRKLAQMHHPDKYATLGEEATAAAKINFQRIKDAYDYLVTYA
ncbi:DnaJ domain-containing protein [Pseudoalteromonas sp. S4488]|uniref:DnaJ domain-containing protein n=2 Tax=Pseudoalteromonas TaxID=53246 RepID=UPI002016A526|nr:DnaJ domain-containing protein [Pseudoalteromonas sp. S4488]